MQSILIQGVSAYWWLTMGVAIGAILMGIFQANGPDDL